MLGSAPPSRSLWSRGKHGACTLASWGAGAVMGIPSLCPCRRNLIPQESCFLRVQGECSGSRGALGARVEEGLSVPLCLGLGFPSAVESGGAQRTARAQRALVHVVRRPHRSAEGTHARQHWIWFLCDSPRL